MADTEGPALRVERGTATEEELAALAVVLLALRGRTAHEEQRPRPAGRAFWRRPGDYRGAHDWQ
ncbi:acyl-CoA carboxylase epsilon subunit [Streptomyces pseudogriseolus]|uniref:acyl-CoA carboxylase epsilon subunit n=1 Tax=Streptomyces pseudogriseolus TaxID=36817 RepID=UPI003FA2C645